MEILLREIFLVKAEAVATSLQQTVCMRTSKSYLFSRIEKKSNSSKRCLIPESTFTLVENRNVMSALLKSPRCPHYCNAPRASLGVLIRYAKCRREYDCSKKARTNLLVSRVHDATCKHLFIDSFRLESNPGRFGCLSEQR